MKKEEEKNIKPSGTIRPDWLDVMKKPIPSSEIEWKQQANVDGKKGTYAIFVTYFTARHAIRILNEAFGRFWSEKHESGTFTHEFERTPKTGSFKGAITKLCYSWKCTIEITDELGTFSRNGYANSADIEPTKSAASNALKRCVSKFGFGLELYDFPKVMVECTGGTRKYPPSKKDMQKALDKIYTLYNEGTAEEKYFIDAKGGLHTFAYGWAANKISLTTGKATGASNQPKKNQPKKDIKAPDLRKWPPYSDKPDSSWSTVMVKWDGNIQDNKDKSKKIVTIKDAKDIFYFELSKAQFEILSAHEKHGMWISKVQADKSDADKAKKDKDAQNKN